MNILGDWKWYAALAIFVVFTALVVWLPGPQAKPAVVSAAATPNASPADLSPVRPEPTVDEQDRMLQYTVQEGDTVESITRLFVVSEDDFRRVNHIPNGGEVTPERRILIPPQREAP